MISIFPDIVYIAVSKTIKISAAWNLSCIGWSRVSSFLYPHLVMLLSRQRAFPNRVRPEKADFPSSRLLSLIFLRLLSLVLTSMSPPIWQLKKNYFHSFWKYSIIKPFWILVTQSGILSIKEVTQKWSWRRVLLVQVWIFFVVKFYLDFL